ncbi:DUF302 domain-containing protein [Nocardia sp. SYP-A9097]|uniref:DUF302 domain-containing protein n=1 Tax=Nocardia sp. SYP-A9097 TaxID=2663237 RepID=UPI00129A27C3|nr:DUF302 domain-containing protein [Nocardia sp. SYP-A9097]MRH87612.1 DUF302 domain-containing protein [Nocardia sp. SYP-A9097]
MEYRVTLCETAPQTVVRVPLEIRPDLLTEGIVNGMRRLEEAAAQAGLTASGAPTITFHRELPADDSITVDFGLPIEAAPALGPSSGAQLVIQPSVLVARTSHRGGYDGIDAAYRALREWLSEAACRPIGPPTEAYLIGPDEVSDPRQLITEIRIPVAPSPAIAVHLTMNWPDAVALTRNALQRAGFRVLTETDMQAVLREQVGEHIEEYLILGVCHPRLAAQGLDADRQAGLLLPCNVVLRADETGIVVEAADPSIMVRATSQRELESVADETHHLLVSALGSLRHPAAAAS